MRFVTRWNAMDYLPLFARLSGSTCLIVGGGTVAVRKAKRFLSAGAQLAIVAPDVTPELRELAASQQITLLERAFTDSDIGEHRLIVAATNDEAVNDQVAKAAEAAGRFCNVVDDRERSSAILPGIVDRSPLLIAVSSSGTSPVLTTRIRQQLERLYPPGIANVFTTAARWRDRIKARFTSVDERRRFWQDTFASPLYEQLLTSDTASADALLDKRLNDETDATGVAWIVGAGPGDPELLTLKAARLIAAADVILHDRLVSPAVLEFARRDAEIIPVGKQGGGAATPQATINELLVKRVRAGQRVCRLKGGDPFIFGRGGEELAALDTAGLPWEVVPGITAAAGCAATIGAPLTHREVARSVTYLTANTADSSEPDWTAFSNEDQTLVVYMGLSKLSEICTQLIAAGRATDCPALLVANGTTTQQQTIRGTLSNLPGLASEHNIQAPALLIIGNVAALAIDRLINEQAAAADWAPLQAANQN